MSILQFTVNSVEEIKMARNTTTSRSVESRELNTREQFEEYRLKVEQANNALTVD